MEQFDLSKYASLSMNQVLKLKLKTKNEFIYGHIIMAGALLPSDKPVIKNSCVWCDFKMIDNFEEYRKEEPNYKDFTIKRINISEIVTIEIISVK